MNNWRCITAALLLAICVPFSAQAAGGPLLVFAAASLKNAMDDVVHAYEADYDKHGAVDIRVSYAGSSTLARQIEQGAPADVYVSANQAWMGRLQKEGHIIQASRIDVLANSLVLVAPEDNDVRLRIAQGFAIADALGDGYLAMANTDAVPAGIYGRQALESMGVWRTLAGHIAQAEDVRAALALVARGETPLGVVYASDAVAEHRVRIVDRFADDSHDPIVYPAALVKKVHGAQNAGARPFLKYLRSDAAARIFKRWGFRPLKTGARCR